MHMIWMSTVIPTLLFVVWAFPATRVPSIWSLCLEIALLGIAVVIGIDLIVFIRGGGQWQHAFMKAVFTVIMNTDIPLLALAMGSVINWTISRRFGRSETTGLEVAQAS